MNDARVLWLSSIYRKTMWGNFFNELNLHEGIKLLQFDHLTARLIRNHLKAHLQLEACVHAPWWMRDTQRYSNWKIHWPSFGLSCGFFCRVIWGSGDVLWRYVPKHLNCAAQYLAELFDFTHCIHNLLVVLACKFSYMSKNLNFAFYFDSCASGCRCWWRSKIDDWRLEQPSFWIK